MHFSLQGQTAIVTGAATGIGEGIARRLFEAGATVAIADRDSIERRRPANASARSPRSHTLRALRLQNKVLRLRA